MTTMTTAPDERALRRHLESAHFQDGVQRGRWRVVGEVEWPHVMIAVSATHRDGSLHEFFFRVDVEGYPELPPNFTPWDPVAGDVLGPEERPTGGHLGRLFRTDWEGGKALYAPFDRVALRSHPNWAQQHPSAAWRPDKGLAEALQLLHRDLTEMEDYSA